MNSLRLELRIRNNSLYKAIYEKFSSVNAFCKCISVGPTTVGLLLNFKMYPRHSRTLDWIKPVQRISDALGIAPEHLFDMADYEHVKRVGDFHVREVDSNLLEDRQADLLQLAAPQTLSTYQRQEFLKRLQQYMAIHLTSREQTVIQNRFGLRNGDNRRLTLAEIGALMKVSRKRIHQLEKAALAKLKGIPELRMLWED